MIINQGDETIKVLYTIDHDLFVGVSFSDNHRVYSLTKGSLKEYFEEFGYTECIDHGHFDEDDEEFLKFLKAWF